MARDLVDAGHVPVAIVTGAQAGMAISWFEPDYVRAGDSGTNYKRLMSRLNAYKLAGSVKSVAVDTSMQRSRPDSADYRRARRGAFRGRFCLSS
jgi:hypothetical protein